MSNVCQICDYNINQSTRKQVSCPYCNFDACRTCCETYVLGESSSKCMSPQCGRDWTREFIRSAFTGTFIKGKLKEHREQLLYDNERALLPATQPLVERVIKRENIIRQMKDINKQITELRIKGYELQTELYRVDNNTGTVERAEFIKSCPDTNCRGFLSSQWKCGLCEKWACNACHEIKGDTRDAPHECNPDVVATVTLLANDTKACPNCRTGIFKIGGCDQMWCTQCHTAFNWRTGRVENVVHNPHYFEWLRRNGNEVPRNPGDVPCRNELQHTIFIDMRNLLRNRHATHPLSKVCESFLERTIRNTIHLRHVILPAYQVVNRERRNEQLRINYMRKIITAEEFKITLQRNEKKSDKSREIHNVLDILLNTATDIVFRFEDHLRTVEPGTWTTNIVEEIDPIVDYVNECLRDISKVYTSKTLRFSNELLLK